MSGAPDLSPREARDRYLAHRQTDARESSLQSWKYRLKHFVHWAEDEGVESMADISGWTIDQYETFRRGEGISAVTLNSEMQTLKNWLQYCARIEIVDDELPEKVKVPEVPEGEETNDEFLDADRAREIVISYREHSERRATQQHVTVELLWFTAARVGAIQALDVRDFHPDEAFVEFRHRPETDTPLKNGLSGERAVGLPEGVVDVVQEYLRTHREDVHDDHGRDPLVTTQKGRPAENTLRVWSYLATQPCIHQDCPHGYERASCDYVHRHHASKCPSSMSPHRIRTGSITWQRDMGLPAEVVAERVNASLEVIEQYYDKASARERMENRRRAYLTNLSFEEDTNA